MPGKRAIRIAGASGSASDRRHAISSFASQHVIEPVDVIIGDWMSEANMTTLSAKKADTTPANTPSSLLDFAFEPSFLEALEPALNSLAQHGIKVAVNAGGSDTEALASVVKQMIKSKGLTLNVAWISGDEVLPAIQKRLKDSKSSEGDEFENICTGEKLRDWGYEPISAQAYLGGLGIAAAFQSGADIVICGRVSDASPVIGAAAWWHGWDRDQLDALANTFVAGHLIECSTYVSGGNFSGFRNLEGDGKGWMNIGYPIAEIGEQGDVVITKQKDTNGAVTVDTCTAQLLYEIQGPWYYNSDVTAILDGIWFEQVGTDRVALKGVKSDLPPPTTKVGLTAKGGFQAEVHWFLVGLDIEAKARMMESQIRLALGPDTSRFQVLRFSTNGSVPENPTNQNAATVDFRVFAQARELTDITPDKFLKPILDLIMVAYPGGTFHLDMRQGIPKPFMEYYVTLLPQSDIQHQVHTHDGKTIDIAEPSKTKVYPSSQPSQPHTVSPPTQDFGSTVKGPLGWLVHGRSGDKGSNANVGFWVRGKEEYEWLRSLLSSDKIIELLADEYNGKKIDRFELPELHAVHFLFHDHLDRGASCSSTYDFLAKNVAEFLRSRHVDLPTRFLNRGKL